MANKDVQDKTTPKQWLLIAVELIIIIFLISSCSNMLGCNKKSSNKWDKLTDEEKEQVTEAHEYWEELNKRGAK